MKILTQTLFLSATILFCSCAAQYKPVSLQPAKTAVVNAQTGTKEAQSKIAEAQASTKRAQDKAASATEKITKLEKQVANDAIALVLAQGVQTDIDELTKELSTTQEALSAGNQKLTWTWDQLQTASGELTKAQKTINENQKYVEKAKITETKYHRLKWGVIALVMAVVGYFEFRFSAVLLGLGYVGIGIMVAVPTMIFSILAFKL